jgi:hypothetical protein
MKRYRRASGLRLLLGLSTISALGLGAGCDPRELDDAVAQAPVRVLGKPDNFGAEDLGRVVVTVPPPAGQTVAARLLAAGTSKVSLALFDFDRTGRASSRSVSDPLVTQLLRDPGIPIGSAVLLGPTKILLGVPSTNAGGTPGGRTLAIEIPAAGGAITATSQLEGTTTAQRRLGLGVAVGRFGGAAADDHAVLSQDRLIIVEDGDVARAPRVSPAECNVTIDVLTLPTIYGIRAIAAGDLAGDTADEIAVGVPQDMAPGAVLIFNQTGTTVACPIKLTPPGGTASKFGGSVAIADLDGDGKSDLIVGAPPDRAYVYRGPVVAGAVPREIAPPGAVTGPGAGDFGVRVGAWNLDDQPGLELVVSAPGMTVKDKVGAGAVYLFRPDGTLKATLADNDPDERAAFGTSISELRFAAPACEGRPAAENRLLVVGATSELYVFFRLPGVARDPRCFSGM